VSVEKENAGSKGISNASKKGGKIGKRHIGEEDIGIVDMRVKDVSKKACHI